MFLYLTCVMVETEKDLFPLLVLFNLVLNRIATEIITAFNGLTNYYPELSHFFFLDGPLQTTYRCSGN